MQVKVMLLILKLIINCSGIQKATTNNNKQQLQSTIEQFIRHDKLSCHLIANISVSTEKNYLTFLLYFQTQELQITLTHTRHYLVSHK